VIIERCVRASTILYTAGLLSLWCLPVDGQAPGAAAGDGWEVPRTEWGHPDLQGNWTNKTLTPLERGVGFGPTFTQAQLDSIRVAQRTLVEAGSAPSDPDRAPPAFGDIQFLQGAYNEVYLERDLPSVAYVNGEPRSSLVTFPSAGRVPELSASGQRRMEQIQGFNAQFGESDHPELRTQSDQCLASFGSNMGPPMLPNGLYNNNYTIVQNEDHVLILTEMVHDTRIIPLREPSPVPDQVRPWFGVSSGRWEGNTLVVETTNIYPRQIFRRVRHTESVRVVERFARVGDRTILYEFEIDDPDMYSERWGGQVPMARLDDLLFEYACHEGNYAMEGILSGARYQERMGTVPPADANDRP
jgi:hypothetical protein